MGGDAIKAASSVAPSSPQVSPNVLALKGDKRFAGAQANEAILGTRP